MAVLVKHNNAISTAMSYGRRNDHLKLKNDDIEQSNHSNVSDLTFASIDTIPVDAIIDKSNESTCIPQNKVVFIKTAKTGGSTMSTIIYRYGLKHDLVAAVDPGRDSLISEDESGKHYIIETYNCSDFPGYNIMASHIFYNRPAMEEIVENAKYVTIIRSPHARLKSSFYFSGKDKLFPNTSNPLQEYLQQRYDSFKEGKARDLKAYVPRFRLPLSIDPANMMPELERLDSELDLVMLTEYYDESLILLKKLMCWEFEDIVYAVSMKAHTIYQPPITPKMADMITELSLRDIQFYNYFNETFWKKVNNYDGDFSADLETFRTLKEDISSRCSYGNESDYCELLHIDANRMSAKSLRNNYKWIC
ncbi:galactosylceramide sulfotransferase-like [Glandiceps talaboti]